MGNEMENLQSHFQVKPHKHTDLHQQTAVHPVLCFGLLFVFVFLNWPK